ncbi:hypothetical protein DFP73DRAFT_561790 [Morchella snyderi]|nr:hypothetical protein DFP73DRAFT_561790 [Morchella snyderi]
MTRQIDPFPAENDRHFMIRTFGDREINPTPEPRSPSPEIPPNFVPEAPKDSSHFPACNNIHNLIHRLSGVSAEESLIIPARTWDRNNDHWEHKFAVLRRKHKKDLSEIELQISKKYDEKYSDAKYRHLVLEKEVREMEFARTDDSVGVLGKTYKDHLTTKKLLEEKYVKKIEELEKNLLECQERVKAQEKVIAEKDASINALKDAIAWGNEQRAHFGNQSPQQLEQNIRPNQEPQQAYRQQGSNHRGPNVQVQIQQVNPQRDIRNLAVSLEDQARFHDANNPNCRAELRNIPLGPSISDPSLHTGQNRLPGINAPPPQAKPFTFLPNKEISKQQNYPEEARMTLRHQSGQYHPNNVHSDDSGPGDQVDENQQNLSGQPFPEYAVSRPLPDHINGGVGLVDNSGVPQINQPFVPNNGAHNANGRLRDTGEERISKRQRVEVKEPGRAANINDGRGGLAISQEVTMNTNDFSGPERRSLTVEVGANVQNARQFLLQRICRGKLQRLELLDLNKIRVTYIDPGSALSFYNDYNSQVETAAKHQHKLIVNWSDRPSPEINDELAQHIRSGATRCLQVSGLPDAKQSDILKSLSKSHGEILAFRFSNVHSQGNIADVEYSDIEFAIRVYKRIKTKTLLRHERSDAKYIPDPSDLRKQTTGQVNLEWIESGCR